MHHGHFCLFSQSWFKTPSWEGSCAEQGTGELSRSPASYCYFQKFMLSFSGSVVVSEARNVKWCPLFCSSATKITVTVSLRTSKAWNTLLLLLLFIFNVTSKEQAVGYFSRFLKFWSTFINHVNGMDGKTDVKVEAYGRGGGKVSFFLLPMGVGWGGFSIMLWFFFP